MRTNKNCPKYGEDLEAQLESVDMEKAGGKSISLDPSGQPQQKGLPKKLIAKSSTKFVQVEAPEGEKSSLKSKVLPVKFKCSSTERLSDKSVIEAPQSSDKPVNSDSETAKSGKVSRILFPNMVKTDDMQAESRKHTIAIRPPTDTSRGQVDSHKRSIIIRPPTETDREQPHKKIIIKRTKEVIDQDQVSPGENTGFEHRKTRRIVELSSFDKHRKQDTIYSSEAVVKQKVKEDRRWWDEQDKRRNEERLREDRARRLHEEEMRMLKEQERLAELKRYEEDIRREREEEERQKAKKKKKKKAEFRDEYLDDHTSSRYDNRVLERDRSGKRRSVVELGRYAADYTPPTKRRRGGGGEVRLCTCYFSNV